MLVKMKQSVYLHVAQISLGIILPLVLPNLQFGLVYKLWAAQSRSVNREQCQNSCWDTNFKAGYESGTARYKHVFFNSTWQASAMWFLTLSMVVCYYEAVGYLVRLWLGGVLRWRMGVLFLCSVYPHYYAWWVLWNYLNDDFYTLMVDQLFYTSTELTMTAMVLHLADTNSSSQPWKLLVIVGVALGHVLAAAWDQFWVNVVLGEGGLHQVLRDVGFMVPDLFHLLLAARELQSWGHPVTYFFRKDNLLPTLSCSLVILAVSIIL